MLNFQPLRKHCAAFSACAFLGSVAEAALLPAEHLAQIHLLDAAGRGLVAESLNTSCLMPGTTVPGNSGPWRAECFKRVGTHQVETPAALKRWLYERGIPFGHEVLLHSSTSPQDMLLTWKMVIKYVERIFQAHDWLVVDETLYWALFYHADGLFTFGRDRLFTPEEEFQQMYKQQELRQRYPFLKFPY